MKKALRVCVVWIVILCLSGNVWAWADEEGIEAALADIPVEKLAARIVTVGCGRDIDTLERLDASADGETLDYYLRAIYGLDGGGWTDCAVYRAGGAEAFEIAVIRFGDRKAAQAAAETLTEYLTVREGDFTGYAPEQAEIVAGSLASASEYGDAALLICQDADRAEETFQSGYDWFYREPFDPPGKDDMTLYDTSAILAAWESGDDAGLSEKDSAVLKAAGAVIEQTTEPDMTDYEREKALYAWLTANAVYDKDHYDPLGRLDPDSRTPYGPLINGKGICVGIATAFQLLMDMADVECTTVVGASRANVADHAWNMVWLDGEWYCADPTWDVGKDESQWDYFNVTSDWMAGTDHQWDYAAVPEATAADGGAGA